jgi:sugar lactone lactonase YvrE
VYATAGSGGDPDNAIMAYKSGRPDERVFIRDNRVPIRGSSEFCLASDGAIWCASISNTVMRFDGTNWHSVLAPETPVRHSSIWLTAGVNGAMLLSMDGHRAALAPS